MHHYDNELRQLQQQAARAKQLESMIAELNTQLTELKKKVRDLEKTMRSEQKDVDRLEGRGLTAAFYDLIGKKEEKLDTERREAAAARAKYDTAARELSLLEAQLRDYQQELTELDGCRERYAAVLQQKSAEIKAEGGETAEKILRMEEKLAFHEIQKKELKEAIAAGQKADAIAQQVSKLLSDAEGWGTWDLVGGGLIADLAKHNKLDEAQQTVEELQNQLRKFKLELTDVSVNADMHVNVEGFLRFADYFFDGLFMDWAVLDQIHNAQKQVKETRQQIAGVIRQLEYLLAEVEKEAIRRKENLENLILQA